MRTALLPRAAPLGHLADARCAYVLNATWQMRGAVLVRYARWRDRGPHAAVDVLNRSG
jgi:hypothetical protein